MDLSMEFKLELPDLTDLKGKYKTAVIKAMNRAAKPVREQVIAYAASVSKRTGYLPRSIGTKTRTYKFAAVTVVGPKRSFVRKGKKAKRGKNKGVKSLIIPHKYGWLLVRGTRTSRRIDWVSPAWASTGATFPDRARTEIAIEFDRINRSRFEGLGT